MTEINVKIENMLNIRLYKVQAILIMQGCQMALPLGNVARYDVTIYHS